MSHIRKATLLCFFPSMIHSTTIVFWKSNLLKSLLLFLQQSKLFKGQVIYHENTFSSIDIAQFVKIKGKNGKKMQVITHRRILGFAVRLKGPEQSCIAENFEIYCNKISDDMSVIFFPKLYCYDFSKIK